VEARLFAASSSEASCALNTGGWAITAVTVQLNDGSTRVFDYQNNPQLRIGESVRVDNNQLIR
jgi:hypothetical protein